MWNEKMEVTSKNFQEYFKYYYAFYLLYLIIGCKQVFFWNMVSLIQIRLKVLNRYLKKLGWYFKHKHKAESGSTNINTGNFVIKMEDTRYRLVEGKRHSTSTNPNLGRSSIFVMEGLLFKEKHIGNNLQNNSSSNKVVKTLHC